MTAFSQERIVKKADAQFEKLAYIDAIKTYERLAEKGYKTPETLKKLADSYYFNANLSESAKWYSELFELTQEVEPEYYFRYAQSLKSINKYTEANDMMAKFNQLNQSDSRGILAKKQRNYREEIKKNSGRYSIENAGINSEFSDYGTAFFGDKIVFTTARDTGGLFIRRHTWTGKSFTRLYSANVKEDGSVSNPEKFANELKTKYHEATPVFTKDGKTVFFTRNNFNNGKKGKSNHNLVLLKIYKATLSDNGKWSDAIELPFNSDDYQCAHPTLSNDDKTLYFASDMPGTKGLSDIFKVQINDDGTFGTPINLGESINTEGRETFPFISDKNELYFASDGHPGLGGLDIFITDLKANDGLVLNIGEPANSPSDDFAFIINETSKRGFLSSNRSNGNGDDDIYKIKEEKEIEFTCDQLLKGVVIDEKTKEILADVKLTLFDDKFKKLAETQSDSQGNYSFDELDCNQKYYVRAEKELYATKELSVITPKESGTIELLVEMEKTVKTVKIGDDLATAFGIKMIYFDLDKWNIRPDAAVELAKILDVMKEYPNMKIDVRSHTDSRASHSYNEKLSDRRAKSTIDWLVKNGIPKANLTGKGYGENKLVNKCADGVECSEEQHQSNRRSEFVITAL